MSKREDLEKQLQELEGQIENLLAQEDRTADELKTLKGLSDQAEQILARIDTEERAERAMRGIRRPTSEPANPGQPTNGERPEFNSFGEYLQAVARAALPAGAELAGVPCATIDRRLSWVDPERRSTGLEEATGSLGGFLVTKDYSSQLLEKTHEASQVWSKTTKIPLSGRSNGVKIPAVDETSRADGSRQGGIRAYWLNEGGTKTASTAKFMMVELTLNKLIGLIYVTDELLEDASALESWIRMAFQKEFAFKLDNAVINGTGAGQPLGVLNAPALVSVTGASSSGTIVASDVVQMYQRMFPGSHPAAEWYTNVDSLDYLMGMNSKGMTTVDTPAGDLLWVPSGSLANRPYDMLFGKPLHYIEQCAATGTVGDLLFMDLSQYLTISKGGIQSASSIHVNFTTDETAFRFVMRVDGQPWWNNALTPFKGSNTQSPFVAIGTRS